MRAGFAVRSGAIAAVVVASLLSVSGAGGSPAQTPKRGGTVVVWAPIEPPCLNWLSPSCGGGTPALAVTLGEVLKGAFEVGRYSLVPSLVSEVEYTKDIPAPTLFGQIIPSGDFDVALYTYFYAPEAGEVADIYGCGRLGNFTGYCQRLVTRDLDEADRILDPAQRARVLNRADRGLANDVPVIPLWNEPAAATVTSAVRGVVPSFPAVVCTRRTGGSSASRVHSCLLA